MSIFLISDIFVLLSKREPFDEFSRSIKQKADSTVLGLLICLLVVGGVIGESFSLFGKGYSIPWYALVKVIAGLAYCAQYCVYIAMEKQLLADTQEEEDVQD